jgi:lambda repressor-like predicted transcriptional regulator
MEDFLVESNLRRIRAQAGLPMWKLALKAGRAESRICVLEQGAPPRPGEPEKIAKALGVEASEIWPEGDVR